MDQTLSKEKLAKLRAIVKESDHVAILLQDDPDPDALSSAIALRALLGRNKLTTPIFAFTPVTRPENRTMIHLLGIDVAPADTKALQQFDKIAMVEPSQYGQGGRSARSLAQARENHARRDDRSAPARTLHRRYSGYEPGSGSIRFRQRSRVLAPTRCL
jgi:nanoRNase/pAp phosphatase (c-di-AMP/oligoRNAs hydrolase)